MRDERDRPVLCYAFFVEPCGFVAHTRANLSYCVRVLPAGRGGGAGRCACTFRARHESVLMPHIIIACMHDALLRLGGRLGSGDPGTHGGIHTTVLVEYVAASNTVHAVHAMLSPMQRWMAGGGAHTTATLRRQAADTWPMRPIASCCAQADAAPPPPATPPYHTPRTPCFRQGHRLLGLRRPLRSDVELPPASLGLRAGRHHGCPSQRVGQLPNCYSRREPQLALNPRPRQHRLKARRQAPDGHTRERTVLRPPWPPLAGARAPVVVSVTTADD